MRENVSEAASVRREEYWWETQHAVTHTAQPHARAGATCDALIKSQLGFHVLPLIFDRLLSFLPLILPMDVRNH